MSEPRFVLVTPLEGGRTMLAVDRIVQAEAAEHPGCVIWYRDNEMYSDVPSRIEVMQSVTDLYALINGYPLGALERGVTDDEA